MTLRVNILVRTRHSRCLEDYRVSRSRASRAASWRLCPLPPWPPGLQAALPQALEEGRRDAKRCHHQGLRVHPEDDDASDADEHGEREGRGQVHTSGALSAMAQTDLKYVIAYSSVSHMGIVMLGAATLTEAGLNGSVFQMFAHGVMTGLCFALVGLVYEKAHSREIGKMGGFGRVMPGIATAFTVAGLSSLGLPATAGFVAEPLTFLCAWRALHSWWLLPAVAGTFLTAIYVFRVIKQIFWGPPSPHFAHLEDARGPEWVALVILVAVVILFGLVPGLALGPVDTATVPLVARIVAP